MKRLPVQEMFYLPTRDTHFGYYEVSQRKPTISTAKLIWGILLILFITALFADNVFGLTDIARAQTIQPVHDNAYYCRLIEIEPVIGASADEITKYCNSL